MKNFLSYLLITTLTVMIVGVTVRAADTADVTATVTARSVSVTVTDASVAYGNVNLSGYGSTTSDGVNDTQIADNNGNYNETFNIIGTDSASWTLENAIGANQYTHAFCNTNLCDSAPTWTLMQQAAYTTLSSTTVPTGGDQNFDLQIHLPSSSGSYTEQNVNVTVQAVSA